MKIRLEVTPAILALLSSETNANGGSLPHIDITDVKFKSVARLEIDLNVLAGHSNAPYTRDKIDPVWDILGIFPKKEVPPIDRLFLLMSEVHEVVTKIAKELVPEDRAIKDYLPGDLIAFRAITDLLDIISKVDQNQMKVISKKREHFLTIK